MFDNPIGGESWKVIESEILSVSGRREHRDVSV